MSIASCLDYHNRMSTRPGPAKPSSAVRPLSGFHKQLYDAFVQLGVGKPVTPSELRKQMGIAPHEHSQLRRRIKELQDRGYNAHRVDGRRAGEYLYVLESAAPTLTVRGPHAISAKTRAEVLHRAGRRCQMCGRMPQSDGIKLAVDHRIPREWGGTNDVENLEALCEECNGGKKAYFATLDAVAMRRCINYDESVQRIGELLKVFKGRVPPRRLIAAVAMEDEWPRRLRELRDLGWKVDSVRVKGQRGAAKFSYRLIADKPWPIDIRAAIAHAAARRGSRAL